MIPGLNMKMIYKDRTKHHGCLVALDEIFEAGFWFDDLNHIELNDQRPLVWLGDINFLLDGKKVKLQEIKYKDSICPDNPADDIVWPDLARFKKELDVFAFFSLITLD